MNKSKLIIEANGREIPINLPQPLRKGDVIVKKGNEFYIIRNEEDRQMNILEALKLVQEGKKVRKNWWVNDSYIYMNSVGDVIWSSGEPYKSPLNLVDTWEEYKEMPKDVKLLVDFVDSIDKSSELSCDDFDCKDCKLHVPGQSKCLLTMMQSTLSYLNKSIDNK